MIRRSCRRFPKQRLTREEALKGVLQRLAALHTVHWLKHAASASGMTLDPAWASFSESILGSITPGKRADYVVLSKDIMTIPESEILSSRVLATAIDGRPAYGHI